jgi:hypothetical protein
MNSVEQNILACAAELNPGRHQQRRMGHLMSHVVDGDHLINAVVKEGLGGLLYKNLVKSGSLERFDHEQKARLQSIYYGTVRFNLKLIHHLKEVLHALSKEKIQVVLLQGIALLHQIYNDIGLRPLTDIDLWVLEKDYAGLIRILSNQGFERDAIYPNTFRKGSTTLDVHTHILWADRIKARRWCFAKGQEHIYNDTQVVDFEGQETRCLNRYDEVLYLGIHALKHNVERLIWLVDIKGLLSDWSRSDWQRFMDRAKELGQEKTVSYLFFLLLRLLDFRPPLEAFHYLEVKRLNWLERQILNRRLSGDALPTWSPLLLSSTGMGLRKRFFFALENLFPRPEVLRQIFADSPGCKVWQLYCKRLLHLFAMMKKNYC